MGVFIVVLHNAGWDVTRAVLLAGSLGECGAADHGHGGAGTVVDQVGGRRDAGVTVVGVERVVVDVADLAGGAGGAAFLAVVVGAETLLTLVRLGLSLVVFGVLGEVEALDGGSALVADAADDVCDSIGLVAEVTVRDIRDAQASKGLVILAKVQQVLLQLGAHMIYRWFLTDLLARRLLLHSTLRTLHALGIDGLLGDVFVTLLDDLSNIGGAADGAHDVLHVVALAVDQAAQVQDHTLGLVTLATEGRVSVLQGSDLLLVALALTLELLGNLLLEDESLESIVALLLSAGQTESETSDIILLLVNETSEATVLALVVLNLDLELGGLLGELLSKGLELEELLLPGLELLDKEVVALGNLAELGVHSSLEVDEVLPSLHSVAGVLVALTDDLVEVTHGDLGHQGLLDGAAEDGLHTGVAAQLLADVVHHTHDRILVPPVGVLNTLNLTTHDNDLTSGDQLTSSVGRAEVSGDARGGDIAVEGLSQAVNELGALALVQDVGRAGGQNEVAVQIHDQSIGGGVEESAALGGDTQNVRAGLLDKLLDVTGVNDRNVETAPLVDANAVTDRLRGHGQHGRVVADENDTTSRRDGGFDDTDNVGDRQTVEQRPHGEVLESSRGGWELVAEGVILHIDANQVIQARSREAQNAGNLLGVEQVGGLVPVNPHTPEVVTQQVVQGVPGEETQAVRNPVSLVGVVVKVGFGLLAQLADGLRTLLISTGPDAQRDTVESVRRVLLQDEGVMTTVRLALSCADLDIVRETSLSNA